MPYGYDHKYVYSHIGYNLKVTDMQAAVGCAQLQKLDQFITRRKENFRKLTQILKSYEDRLILPRATENSDPSWFGYVYMKIVISTNYIDTLRCGRFAAIGAPDCPFSSFVVPATGMGVTAYVPDSRYWLKYKTRKARK